MKQDKKRLYAVSALFLSVLLLVLLVPDITLSKILLALVTVGAAVAAWFFIPKRSVPELPRREVLMVMAVMGFVLVMLYYLTGLRFGFYRTPVQTSYFWKYIIPYGLSIVASEVLRSILLQQKNKTVNVIAYISMVLMDVLLFSVGNVLGSFNRFREFFGLVLLPAITGNILYHYLSSHYGALPNIAYRLVIALYPYLLPWAPATPAAMVAFARLVVPILIYLFIRKLYEKRKFSQSRQKSVWNMIGGALLLAVMAMIIMLISCQFRYGLLVVGSESMTGALNKGDAIIYEEYTDQVVIPGEIIVFREGQTTYIHRVVDVKHTDGELRYYTKGDVNETMDEGYVTRDEMVGVVELSVKYIGYPTVWLRELFQ